MYEKILKLFSFFGINKNEIHLFFNESKEFDEIDLNIVENEEQFIKFLNTNNDAPIDYLTKQLKINKAWVYNKSNNLFEIKYKFYKEANLCEKLINEYPHKIYIISEKTPNKNIDEINDDNEFYIFVEFKNIIKTTNTEYYTYEIVDNFDCKWGYWRCRWELKKLLLCFKGDYFINKIYGFINKDISNQYMRFIAGEMPFQNLLGSMDIWYPEDYIEFKSQNVNAKEEDELKDILNSASNEQEIMENNKKDILDKLKQYLIDIYKIDELNIRLGDELYDLIIKYNNNRILFEINIVKNKNFLKQAINTKKRLISSISKLNHKPKYIVIVLPYENDFDFYIYSQNDNYQKELFSFDIGIKHNIDLVNNIFDFLYSDGKISKLETIQKFYEYLYDFLHNKIPKNIEEKIVFRYLYLIDNIRKKELIDEIIEFDNTVCKFYFKEEFIDFLNKEVKNTNITFENFQYDFMSIDYKQISIYEPQNLIEKFMILLFDITTNNFYENTIIVYDNSIKLSFSNALQNTYILVKQNEYDKLLKKINSNKIIKIYIFEKTITTNTNDIFLLIQYNPRLKNQSKSEIIVDSSWREKTKSINIKSKINLCDCEQCIRILGIKQNVLNFEVIQGFISIGNLKKMDIKTLNIQRDIDKTHINKLKKYIEKGKYQFLPNIIFGLENSNELKKDVIEHLDNNNVEVCLSKELQEKLKIIDGNHRFNALKQIDGKDKLLIGFTIILFQKEQFAPIFYTLNSKMKPLNAENYVNFVRYLDNNIKVLNSLQESGLLGLENFENIKDIIREFKLVDKIDKEIEIFILKLSEYFEMNQINIKKYDDCFIDLLRYSFKNNLDISVLRNVFQSVFKYEINDEKKEIVIKKLQKEFDGFLEYIQMNSFESMIKDNDDIDLLYETYKKTYIPKSRKIYLSMPYHIHEDVIYFVAKDVVNKVSQQIGENIELIRTDKRKLGVHGQIESKIYNEIEECDLMIADITGNNPNVYAEVGYKMAIDKSNGLKEPQIIFVKNSRGYYEKVYYNEKALGKYHQDEIIIDEKVRRNKVSQTAFNFAHIDQIEFEDVEYLQRELENMLLKYYNYYKIKK